MYSNFHYTLFDILEDSTLLLLIKNDSKYHLSPRVHLVYDRLPRGGELCWVVRVGGEERPKTQSRKAGAVLALHWF